MRTMRQTPWVVLFAAVPLIGLFLGAQAIPRTPLAIAPAAGAPLASTEIIKPQAYLPLVSHGTPILSVNPQNRQASLDFYNTVYLASEGAPIDWTGNHAACGEGTTSAAFRQAVQLRINYFRAMAGVPATVILSDEFTAKAQKAALMMSVNRQLSHSPDSSWICYSAEGAEAAGKSNLYLGVYGPNAISGYIYDPGSGNYAVGHRRWILYPQTESMGSGDIPPAAGYPASNALWVFDANIRGPRPATREEFVAWPPPGYVPSQVVYPRWSFSYARADFSNALVSMRQGSVPVALVQQTVVNGYGENTLVWEPQISLGVPPASDTTYTVTVENVVVDENRRDFTYDVIVFDAGSGAVASAATDGQLGPPPEN